MGIVILRAIHSHGASSLTLAPTAAAAAAAAATAADSHVLGPNSERPVGSRAAPAAESVREKKETDEGHEGDKKKTAMKAMKAMKGMTAMKKKNAMKAMKAMKGMTAMKIARKPKESDYEMVMRINPKFGQKKTKHEAKKFMKHIMAMR